MRVLAAPLGRGLLCLLGVLVPPLVLNQVIAPHYVPNGASLRPGFDLAEDVLAVAMLASVVVVIALGWRRVAFSIGKRLAYVAALVAMQMMLTAAAELGLFESRGGLQLFAPHLASTTALPDGRTAFLYRDGFLGCEYSVTIAEPWSPIMRPELSVTRTSCQEPLPLVVPDAAGHVSLHDADGKPLEPQASPGFSFWHDC